MYLQQLRWLQPEPQNKQKSPHKSSRPSGFKLDIGELANIGNKSITSISEQLHSISLQI